MNEAVKLWDTETGREVATLPGVSAYYATLGFSPDGDTLFAASLEGTVLLWHAPKFAEIERGQHKERSR